MTVNMNRHHQKLHQIPQHELRSVKTDFLPYKDLPDKSCRGTMGGSCPVTILMTGDKQPLGKALSANIFATSFAVNSSDLLPTLANNVLGTTIAADKNNYADPGLASGLPIYSIQPLCNANSTWPLSLEKIQTGISFTSCL
ncbi:ABC transporter A family member 12-like isoform X2 [Raphanus sativus]|uniref:ABC transporter A family member 12-like isoform X2 n=1 Tax=Raphanus sativus TaxID=3726 RepID=A0A9W3DJB9_RAPSA|nr:ABC transporter A family member 12-like isoform X2 [Raphanus sativus]